MSAVDVSSGTLRQDEALHKPVTASDGIVDDISTQGCDPVKTRRELPYKPWQEISAEKKAEQLARIPREWLVPETVEWEKTTTGDATDLRPLAAASGVLTDEELDVTGDKHDATALVAMMADGRLTAVQVVTAFCKRAAVAQQVCNCLTEIMFSEAIAAAKALDEVYKKTGKTVGPLHGLPMTFKVCKCLYAYLCYLYFYVHPHTPETYLGIIS